MTEAEIIEQAIQRLLSAGTDASRGTFAYGSSLFAVFYAALPATIEQLEIAAATYRDEAPVACEHCWASLNLAKDVLGIERDGE